MKIVISGKPGSGKSTVARLLAKLLGVRHYSTGDFMRELAQQRRISLAELSSLAEKDISIDKALDERQARLGNEEKDFVIDSRIGWRFISDSFKVYLDCSLDERAKRIFKDKRKTEKAQSLGEIKKLMLQREKSERVRFRQYYGIDNSDLSVFDLVIDTTSKAPEDVAKIIAEKIKSRK